MSTEKPNVIDEKKAEEKGNTTDKADWSGFLKNFSNGAITGILVGVVFIGSIGLFLTKVANANILPTTCDAIPYDNFERKLGIDIIYMNPVKQLSFYGLGFWAQPLAYWIQEANFVNEDADLNFMKKFTNTWLCSLGYKADPISDITSEKPTTPIFKSPFWTFEHNTLKSMLCMSFTILSTIFYYMNYLPEWAIMIFFAYFFSIILTIIYMGNFIYGAYSHLSNIPALWKNLWDSDAFNGIPPSNIEPKGVFDYTKKFLGYVKLFLYFLLYLMGAVFSAIAAPVFITCYTFIKALSATYVVRQKEPVTDPRDAPKMNLLSFIKNIVYYKKTFIIILVMLNLMGAANQYLGKSYMPGVIIAILILIFGMNILTPDDPSSTLFAVNLKAEFPPLSQPPAEKGIKQNSCFPEVKEKVNDAMGDKISKVTNQPVNVLKSITKGGSKFFKGGNAKKSVTPKVKMYNVKLV
jgi:hypothetical protein